MEHIEIERKFLPPALPDGLERYPHKEFLQGYLSTSPTVRVRREGEAYQAELPGLLLVEVEFPDEASARAFTPPAWFGREVTGDPRYQNSSLSRFGLPGEEKA